jgi:hypothetical protein
MGRGRGGVELEEARAAALAPSRLFKGKRSRDAGGERRERRRPFCCLDALATTLSALGNATAHTPRDRHVLRAVRHGSSLVSCLSSSLGTFCSPRVMRRCGSSRLFCRFCIADMHWKSWYYL